METLEKILSLKVKAKLEESFDLYFEKFEFQLTRKDFEGDITLMLFPLLKPTRQNPSVLGESIGRYLVKKTSFVSNFNVVSGFLNLIISDRFYLTFLNEFLKVKEYGHISPHVDSPTIMVEYSSPNTNKPLHLGHVRNNLLGYSVSKILEANGNNVIRTCLLYTSDAADE